MATNDAWHAASVPQLSLWDHHPLSPQKKSRIPDIVYGWPQKHELLANLLANFQDKARHVHLQG